MAGGPDTVRLTGLLLALVAFVTACAHRPMRSELMHHGLRLVVDATPHANLLYHLDCLAEAEVCSRAAFASLWQDQLGWSAVDDQMLARWRGLFERYRGMSVQFPDREGERRGFPFAAGGVSFAEKWRIASAAEDMAVWCERIELLLDPADVAQARAVVAHFQPRFGAWWQRSARPLLARFLRRTEALFRRQRLATLVQRFAGFYGLAAAKMTVEVHLVARPGRATASRGRQIERHAFVEVVPGEAPQQRVDVIIHELAHWFFRISPLAPSDALLGRSEPAILPAWSLFDEAVASALQALVLQRVDAAAYGRAMTRPRGLYDDDLIDEAAKSIVPLVRERVDRGETMADFGPHYLRAVAGALGDRLGRPVALLREMELVYDGQPARPVAELLRTRVRPRHASLSSPIDADESRDRFERYRDLSGVILVTESRLDALSGWSPILGAGLPATLRAAVHGHAGIVWAVRRSPSATIFLVVGGDEAALRAGVERLVAMASTGEGLLATLD